MYTVNRFYVIINSYCMNNLGLEDYRSTLINTALSCALFLLVVSLDRTTYYGLQKVEDMKKYLYFIPLLIIAAVNLLNGAELKSTLFQMCYAIILGYMLVIIFYRSKSIIPCVIFHALINALSVFNVEKEVSYLKATIFVVVIPVLYIWYIHKTVKE